MNAACLFGSHTWNGCKCLKCGKTRDESHNWSNDCETCSICGRKWTDHHKWDGCVCTVCKKTRDEFHNWEKDCETCSRCGKKRVDAHIFVDGFCKVCGFECKTGVYIDERDGKRYNTVKIGSQFVLAQNFAFKPDSGNYWAYDNDSWNVEEFGLLYTLETARSVVPAGWHLPTIKEWNELGRWLRSDARTTKENYRLFNPVMGGWRWTDGKFYKLRKGAYYWTYDDSEKSADPWAWYFDIYENTYQYGEGLKNPYHHKCGFSIRLFKDVI
jgi:uncharacterized protein (TIGR02145 family)